MERTELFIEIKYKDFNFSDYRKGEQTIISPQLEKLGYFDIEFFNIEADSFGPLIRGVNAKRMVNGQLELKGWYYG